MSRLTKPLWILILSFTGSASAGNSSGVVTKIYAHAGDVVMFSAGSHNGKPSCSGTTEEWAFSVATATGKAMLAVLLSAQAQGKPVGVTGTDTCTAWADRETPKYITIE